MNLVHAIIPLLALLIGTNAQSCELETSDGFVTVSCTDSDGQEITSAERITLNDQPLADDVVLPAVISRGSFVVGVNTILVTLNLGGFTAVLTLRLTISSQPTTPNRREIACGYSQSGDSVVVECTVNDVAFTGLARYAINSEVDPQSTPKTMPLSIPITEFMQETNTLSLLLDIDGSLVAGPSLTVIVSTTFTGIRCNVRTINTVDGSFVEVTCFMNGAIFTGEATYTINDDPMLTDIEGFPLTLATRLFTQQVNSLVVRLNVNGETREFRTTVTLPDQPPPPPASCSYNIGEEVVTITCTGAVETIAAYRYSINGGPEMSGTGAVDIRINVADLNRGNPNTVNLILLAAGGALIGEVPISFSLGTLFQVRCTSSTSELDELISQVSCMAVEGSEAINRYEYTVSNGPATLFTGSGSTFPIAVDQRRLAFGENTLSVMLISQSGRRALLTLNFRRNRPFNVQCTAVQSSDGENIEVSCFYTGTGTQTIDTLQYFINGLDQGSLASESGNISFLIPITNDAINIGRVNELSFALTGSEGSEVTTTIRLQVQATCLYTLTNGEIRITCSGELETLTRSYRYSINGGQAVTVSQSPIVIPVSDLQLSQTGSVVVELTLISADGRVLGQANFDIQVSQLADCVFGGVTYSHGSSFPAGDGCNTCSCSNGRVFCTEIACPPPRLTVSCQPGGVAGRQTFQCQSSNRIETVMCSFDGGPAEVCQLPLVLGVERFGVEEHSVVLTVTDEFGQSVNVDLTFQLIGPELTVSCQPIPAVPGRQTFQCQSSNRIETVMCSFDGGPAEVCQLPLVLGVERFGVEEHSVVLTVTDEFGQSVNVDLTFQLTGPRLTVSCQPSSVPGRQTFQCQSSNRIETVMCSFDGGPAEVCQLPLVLGVGRFGVEEHSVVLTVTDEFGQSVNVDLTFQLIGPELTVSCRPSSVPGRQTLQCQSSNRIETVMCSFDGGPAEVCQLPLVLGVGRFGVEEHSVVLTVTDEFGQSVNVDLTFQLIGPELTVRCQPSAAVPGRQTFQCQSSNRIETVMCSFDGGPAEVCQLPLVLGVERFGVEEHSVVLTVTDEFGQSVNVDLTFQLTGPRLTVSCQPSSVPGRQTFQCQSSNRIETVMCSFDGGPAEVCQLPLVLGVGRFGVEEHSVILTVTDEFGQSVNVDLTFQLIGPELTVSCRPSSVPGRQTFQCQSSNRIETVMCSFDGGPAEVCQLPLVLGVGRFGVEEHSVILTVTDEFGQSVNVDLTFQLIGPRLTVSCQPSAAVPGRQTFQCQSSNRIETVMCSFDGGPAEVCQLPLVLGVGRFGVEEHSVILTVTDEFGQSVNVDLTFQLIGPRLTVSCQPSAAVPGRQTFQCQSSNRIETVMCSFDGGPAEVCQLPLVLGVERFGVEEHSVVLTVTDEFGQSVNVELTFQLIEPLAGPIQLAFLPQFVVSEGSLRSRLSFGITGTSLESIPFSLLPLTYRQFQDKTGRIVENVFSDVMIPSAASDSDIIAAVREDFSFGPADFPLAGDYFYNVNSAVFDDEEVEGDEGFILYFEFDRDEINSDDYSRLDLGTGAILVTIEDDDRQFLVTCRAIVEQFIGGIDCRTTGGVGSITYSCSIDGEPATPCSPFPFVLNLVEFSLEEHTLSVTATDANGSTGTFIYSFIGRRPPDLVLMVVPSVVITREDGISGSVRVFKSGYSFGEVSFSLQPLTYAQYRSISSSGDLDSRFPFRPPTAASTADFNQTVLSASFAAGLVPQPPYLFSGSGLALPDREPEFTEGFLLYLQIDESSLNVRDQARLQSGAVRVVNGLVLVSIPSNDLALSCTSMGNVLQSLLVDCTGVLPPDISSSSVVCTINGESNDCSNFPTGINTAALISGSYTIRVSASTATGESVAVGEASFSVPEIDLYFINDTPLLVGGTVYAEFTADRPGLRFFCHLTHFDDPGFRQDCSNGTYRREGLPHGDYTLRVIALDAVRGEKKVIRDRLWVHSVDPNDAFCIMYLKNRGWGVSGDTFSVDFTATGAASGSNAEFECSLNRVAPEKCRSPYVLSGLPPGRHHVRVRPTGCGRDYRVWNKRFTISNE